MELIAPSCMCTYIYIVVFIRTLFYKRRLVGYLDLAVDRKGIASHGLSAYLTPSVPGRCLSVWRRSVLCSSILGIAVINFIIVVGLVLLFLINQIISKALY